MRKFLSLLCLLALWCVGGQAGIFKPGTRATTLQSGTYFVYNTCWVDGSADWTGFFYSADGAMKVNHGSKTPTYSTYDPSLYWNIEVVDAASGKCTMRNAQGLYVDCSGNLTAKKSYIWITTYVFGETGACGNDVYAEAAGETTSSLPSTTAADNAGLWLIGNQDKSVNWTSNSGTAFKTHSAGQPMALYPAKTTAISITSEEDLSAPETLEIGSYVMLYSNAAQKYVSEGSTFAPVNIGNASFGSAKLFLSSFVSTSSVYNTTVFKVGGEEGAYTFQNVVTGDYIQPLNNGSACYAGSNAEKFSITVNDGTIALVGSNGQNFDQQGSNMVVGWNAPGGGNAQYKIKKITELTTEDVDVVEVMYDCLYGDNTYLYQQQLVSPKDKYTYLAPPTYYDYTTSNTAPTAEVLTTSKTVEYSYTKDDTKTLPFTTSTLAEDGKFAENTKWQKIYLRKAGKYAKYTSDTSIPASTNNTANDFACMFMVSGDAVSGYKIQNLAAGADKYLTVNDDNGSCKFTTTGTTFDYTVSQTSGGDKINLFKARGTSNVYLHDYENSLGTWRSDGATTDIGSTLVFTEIDDLEGTVIFEGGGYDDTDVIVYNNTEYANGAKLPWYNCYNTTGVTLKSSKLSFMKSSMLKSGIVAAFSFEPTTITNGKFAEGTKWYNLTIRSTKNCIYDIYDKTTKNLTSTARKLNYGSMYCFVKDENVTNGYKMYNRAAGPEVSFYNSGKNNEIGEFTAEGSTLILKTNGTSGFVFQINGVDNAHVNDVYNQLGVWNDGGSATDGGSSFLFEEISDDDLTTAESLPQPGKFYTIQETSTSQYLTPALSTVSGKTSRLAMNSSASEADRIFYFTGLHLLGFSNGRFVGISDNMLTQAAVGNAGTSLYFNKQSDGVFNIIYNDSRTLHGANSGYADGGEGTSLNSTGYQFKVVEVTDLPLTIGTNGWSTFSAPVKVAVPEGVTAYYAPSDPTNGKLVLADLEGQNVPANTGIIVKGIEGNTVKFTTLTTEDETAVEGNKLVSNVVATSLSGSSSDGNYAFATNTNTKVSGFMKLLTTITLPGHKCWLKTNTSSSSAQFVPIALADDPTGIESAETTTVSDSDAPIYDLQGRKVNSTTKGGMYIQNGKVFIAM
jgi:hypothetical protein